MRVAWHGGPSLSASLPPGMTDACMRRPFMWGGDLYISHWVYSEDTKPVTVVQAISRVDVEKKEVRGSHAAVVMHCCKPLETLT